MEVGRLTWSCHFCGRMRDDADIAVAARVRLLAPTVPVRETRRYCCDSNECRGAAERWRTS